MTITEVSTQDSAYGPELSKVYDLLYRGGDPVRRMEQLTRRVGSADAEQTMVTAGDDWVAALANYLCGLTWDGTHLWHSDHGHPPSRS